MITKLLGVLLLLGSFVLVYLFETSSTAIGWVRIFHWPAIVLTGVGPLGLLFVSSDLKAIGAALSLLTHSPKKMREIARNERRTMRELSERYYAEGARALDMAKDRDVSVVFRSVLDKLALRIPISDIRVLLREQQDSADSEVSHSISIMALAVKLTPSVGMLGTILGMVNLLSSLQDPSEIGSHMSLALLTTFYGLFFSLAVWTPAQYRLQTMLTTQHQGFDQIDHWLALLESRKPPEYIEKESIFSGKKKK